MRNEQEASSWKGVQFSGHILRQGRGAQELSLISGAKENWDGLLQRSYEQLQQPKYHGWWQRIATILFPAPPAQNVLLLGVTVQHESQVATEVHFYTCGPLKGKCCSFCHISPEYLGDQFTDNYTNEYSWRPAAAFKTMFCHEMGLSSSVVCKPLWEVLTWKATFTWRTPCQISPAFWLQWCLARWPWKVHKEDLMAIVISRDVCPQCRLISGKASNSQLALIECIWSSSTGWRSNKRLHTLNGR